MKKTIALLSLCTLCIILQAQRTYESESPLRLLNEGKAFFAERNYAGTTDKLHLFLEKEVGENDREEAEYLLAACAYYMGDPTAMEQVRNYLETHADGRYTNEATFFLGSLFFGQHDYKKAIFWLNEANIDLLTKQQQDEYCLRVAYADLQEKKYDEASHYFALLERNSDDYRTTAQYYLAYIRYAKGDYTKALSDFTKLKESPEFREKALYFTTQINYAEGRYARAIDEGMQLLKNYPDAPENVEIKRIIGNAHYLEGDLQKAITYLAQYAQESENPHRDDLYILGVCYFSTRQDKEAIAAFSKTVTKEDEITQNAYLYLGQLYLRTGDKYNARMAFEAASKSDFDRNVQEAALYNYALLIHETFSAFGENVRVFEEFLNRFPNSKYADQVSKYLVEVYLTTKNYPEALASIEKIKSPGPKILGAKQSILYQLGLNAYTNANYDNAATLFSSAVEVGNYNAADRANAYFWRAESYAKTERYDWAQRDYQSYLSSPEKIAELTGLANYGLGYSLFNRKKYGEALPCFNACISNANHLTDAVLADAYNRKGDCLFYTRDFAGAKLAYNKGEELLPSSGDYALYQLAIIEGINKRYDAKINLLNQLDANYPESSYADDALFEKGRTYVMTENAPEAEKTFIRLIDKYPNSVLARKAGLQLGLLYFDNNRLDDALSVLKEIQKNYPGTEEAKTALQDMKTIYVEKNDVNGFVNYSNSLGGSSRMEVREQDSLSYIAAEKLYMRGEYNAALKGFEEYLNNFGNNGIFVAPAHFYSSKIYYNNGNFDTALDAVKKVLHSGNLAFREEALMMKADIEYAAHDYGNAAVSFEGLYNEAHENTLKQQALSGLLRSAYYNNAYDKAADAAAKMLATERVPIEMHTEASYIRAKSLIALNRAKEAAPLLAAIQKDTRNAYGAEARYLLAQYHFDAGQKKEAEKEVMNYIDEGTPHAYWLARSFILLADIYIGEGDTFQARQYLESLKTNYKNNDDILPAVEKRLEKINK